MFPGLFAGVDRHVPVGREPTGAGRRRTMSLTMTSGGRLLASLAAAFVLLAGVAEAQAPSGQPDAKALIVKMGEFLGKTPRMSATVRSNYDTVQASGQKIEW